MHVPYVSAQYMPVIGLAFEGTAFMSGSVLEWHSPAATSNAKQ